MEKQPTSSTCFLCGRDNNIGLKMSWDNDYENEKVVGNIKISEEYNGYPGIAHGGIVATILDETSGRAVMLDRDWDNLMVTAKLEVEYKLPTPCGEALTAVGWVIKRGKKYAKVAGEIRHKDGTVTATCTAIVVRPSKEFIERFEQEKDEWHS